MARLYPGSARLFHSGVPVSAAPFTIHCSFRVASLSAGSRFGAIGVNGSAENFWAFRIDASGAITFQARTTSSTAATTSTAAVVNTLNSATIVEGSATSHNVFLNGGGKATATTSRVPAGVNCTVIGGESNSGIFATAGTEISNFAIWRTALTDTEVRWLARGVTPFQIQPRHLALFAPLGLSAPDPDLVQGRLFQQESGVIGFATPHANSWRPGTFRNLYGSTHVPLGVPLAKWRPRDRDILYAAASGSTIGWFDGSSVLQKPIYRKESGGAVVPATLVIG